MKQILFLLVFLVAGKAANGLSEDGLGTELPSVDSQAPQAKTNDVTDPLETRKKYNKLSKGNPQIYKLSMRSDAVYRLQTAVGYVSTIDLPEPALKVFIGDQELFKVGVYEKEVLIKPLTDYPDARTNVTIYTESGRLAFDVSVGPAETADFVLDFRMPEEDILVENAFQKAIEEKEGILNKAFKEKEEKLEEKTEALAQEKFKEEIAQGTKTLDLKKSEEIEDIRLNLISLSLIGEKVYLRFGVRNLSNAPFKISRVIVGIETYNRRNLGLKKSPLGLAELSSELKIENPVPPAHYVYGVVTLDPRALGKKERPVFMLFEEDGKAHFKIKDFAWIP